MKNSQTVNQDIGKIVQGLADVGNGAQAARTNFANADASLQKGQYIDALHSTYKGMDGVSKSMQGALNAGATIANRAGATGLGKNMSDLSSGLHDLQTVANGFAQPLDSANSFLKTFNDPAASDADKRTAAGNFVNTTMKSFGDAIKTGADRSGVDDAFVNKLHTTLTDYGAFGTSMAGLAQNGQDFRTAASAGDLNGMWKAGSSALQNGVAAGQIFSSHVGATLKEGGFTRAGTALENFGSRLGTLKTAADALVASNQLLPTDGTSR